MPGVFVNVVTDGGGGDEAAFGVVAALATSDAAGGRIQEHPPMMAPDADIAVVIRALLLMFSPVTDATRACLARRRGKERERCT